MTGAQFLSVKKSKGRIIGGAFTVCVTRGLGAVVMYFPFDARAATDWKSFNALARPVALLAGTLVSNMSFVSAPSGAYMERQRTVELDLATGSLPLSVGDAWSTALAYPTGAATGELLLLRETEGVQRGFVWLAVLAAPPSTDLDKIGQQAVQRHLALQSGTVPELALEAAWDDATFAATSKPARSLLFSVKDGSGTPAGAILATAALVNGKLYVVSAWTAAATAENGLEALAERTVHHRIVTTLANGLAQPE